MGADIGLNKTSEWSDEIPDGQVVAAELRRNCCGISRRIDSPKICLAAVVLVVIPQSS
jgi:hypothetical protein